MKGCGKNLPSNLPTPIQQLDSLTGRLDSIAKLLAAAELLYVAQARIPSEFSSPRVVALGDKISK